MGGQRWYAKSPDLAHATHLRGQIVRLSDKIAYINSDFDDAIRAQLLCEDDIPLEIRNTLGHSTKARLNHMVHNIITNSMGKDDICMSKESAQAMQDLRKFMFANLYNNPVAKARRKRPRRCSSSFISIIWSI